MRTWASRPPPRYRLVDRMPSDERHRPRDQARAAVAASSTTVQRAGAAIVDGTSASDARPSERFVISPISSPSKDGATVPAAWSTVKRGPTDRFPARYRSAAILSEPGSRRCPIVRWVRVRRAAVGASRQCPCRRRPVDCILPSPRRELGERAGDRGARRLQPLRADRQARGRPGQLHGERGPVRSDCGRRGLVKEKLCPFLHRPRMPSARRPSRDGGGGGGGGGRRPCCGGRRGRGCSRRARRRASRRRSRRRRPARAGCSATRTGSRELLRPQAPVRSLRYRPSIPAAVREDHVHAAVAVEVADLDRLRNVVARIRRRRRERPGRVLREDRDERTGAVAAVACHHVVSAVAVGVADADPLGEDVRPDAVLGRCGEPAARRAAAGR